MEGTQLPFLGSVSPDSEMLGLHGTFSAWWPSAAGQRQRWVLMGTAVDYGEKGSRLM